MKVLMLSTDKNILQSGTEVHERMKEYANLIEELHVVVYGRQRIAESRITANFFIYSTVNSHKIGYFRSAYNIGQKILADGGEWIITAQDPFETGLVGYWLKKRFKTPLQLQIHTDFLSPYFWQESVKNKIRVLLAKWLVKKADCIRVVSERIKGSLISQFPNFPISRIIVLPIFIDVDKIRTASVKTDLRKKYPGYDFIILMASRLTKEKNIKMAIASFENAKHQMSPVKNPLLLIVGDGPKKRRLDPLVVRYSLGNNVKFEPWTDDLASYYKTADLFLLTSNYEGYGRTIIEALAADCPVISTDVGIAKEFIDGNHFGIIIAPNDMRALVGGLQKMAGHKERYHEFKNIRLPDKNTYLDLLKRTWLKCDGN
ncbi:MAG: glycosyltransferase family 4 protein [bacterium]|nr:glycosyltransferase family 4 protein [bacterium]